MNAYILYIYSQYIFTIVFSLSISPLDGLTHFCPLLRFHNQFLPTIQTFAVRETSVSRTTNVGTVGMNVLINLQGDSVNLIEKIHYLFQSFYCTHLKISHNILT